MLRVTILLLVGMLAVGCSERSIGTATTPTETTAVAFNVSGAPTVEFDVPDMMCAESCAVKVNEILSEQPGAKEVVVDFDTKTATVAVDEDKFDAQAAIAALVDHMFENSALKTAKSDATPATDVAEPPAG